MTTPLTAAAQTAALLLGDAAQINPAPATEVIVDGANTLAMKAKALTTAQVYGSQHARGEASLTKLAFYFSGSVRAKVLDESDAEMLYKAFIAGHNRVIDAAQSGGRVSTGHELMANDEKTIKHSVSIFRTFGKRAAVSMGENFYARVLTVRHGIGPSDRLGSAYNAMVTCNRKVEALGEKSATVDIDDATIASWITKKPVATKDDLDKLAEITVKLAKMVNANLFVGLGIPVAQLESFVAKLKAATVATAAAPKSTDGLRLVETLADAGEGETEEEKEAA